MGQSKPLGSNTRDAQNRERAEQGKCPICGAPWEPAFRPFCSRRCADVDLARWLRGGYAVPGRADVDEDGDDAAISAGRAQPDPPHKDDDE